MGKGFTRFPFWGWLFLALLFLIGDSLLYRFKKQQFSPVHLASEVQQNFYGRERALKKVVKSGMIAESPDKDGLFSLKDEFSVVLFDKEGVPVYWNNNEITDLPLLQRKAKGMATGGIIQLQAGIFYANTFWVPDSGEYAVALIPIAFQYNIPHEYFHSYFVAGGDVPADATVGQSGQVIRNTDGSVAFHLKFNEDTFHLFKIGGWIGLLSFLTLSFGFIWFHKICVEIGNRSKAIYGWLTLFIFSLLFNFFRNKLGYPAGFENAGFFSPNLLASTADIGSLPDLCFYVFFDSWLLLYFVKYLQVKDLIKIPSKTWNTFAVLILAVVLVFELFYGQAGNMHVLVIDSKLPFVVNDIQNLTAYTFVGIGLMCLITLNFILLIHIIDELLKGIMMRDWLRYSVFVAVCILCIFVLRQRVPSVFDFTLLLLSVGSLLLLRRYGVPVSNSGKGRELLGMPHGYVWLLVLCSWVTIEIFYFNFFKEKEIRKVYATRLDQQDDAVLSYDFRTISKELPQDKLLRKFWKSPSQRASQSINQHISSYYLEGVFQKYKATFHYYNSEREAVLPQDTLGAILLRRADSIAGIQMKNGFISLQNPIGKNMYWAMVPVFDTYGKGNPIGYLGIDFSTYNSLGESPTATLLAPENNPADEQYFRDYSYAVYQDHKLEAQSGNFTFPYRSYFDSKNKTFVFKEHWDFSDLFYRPSPDELIVIRYGRNIGANVISLFSYVLIIWLTLFVLFLLIDYLTKSQEKRKRWRNRFNLTIRAKVNWTIMMTVLLSLLVVGGITVSFLKNRYQTTQRRELRNLLFFYRQSIVHFIENQKIGFAMEDSTQLSDTYPSLTSLLNTLAGEQGLDINLYNKQGYLIATSQNLLVQKGYLSSLMNPEVIRQLSGGLNADWQGFEKLGELKYQSFYLPLRNKSDEIIAYLNIPYYDSQGNLKSEISGILTTLINIYMLLFFIAGISALLISNSIVRSFYLLIEQFRRIRLERNVLIQWPYKDELGLLVTEYNNMILKVEKMAARLANSEREAAWRELALQIAHEIKNPLTPMKLNIQYLLKSFKEGREDITEMAERISGSLIEQIENLNVIATEFAHFARMPEARPEKINVAEQLQSLIGLHQKEVVKMEFSSADPNVCVWMDKGYFIRVFTNLLKNGIQSIPPARQGFIAISITIGEEAKEVKISIKDNGSGIPEDIQKKVFTPHFTTKSSGSGIGLAMSRQMVELSKGRIDFKTKIGEGTEFFVVLPLLQNRFLK